MSNYSEGKLDTKKRNTAWAKIFDYIFDGSTVLDFGCSDGVLGGELKRQKNCTVYGVEIDDGDLKKAKKVLDGVFNFNIEKDDIPKELKAIKFDAIILADVIEHFVHPSKSLAKLRTLLNKNGRIIFSIPNMAHLSVRMKLLEGSFDYTETGLLDKTHLHFYDYNEVKRVFTEAGMQIEHNDANTLPFPPSFLRKKLNQLGLEDKGFIEKIQGDRLAQSFQFVGYAKPMNDMSNLRSSKLSTSTPEAEFINYIDNLQASEERLVTENAELIAQIGALQSEIAKMNKLIPMRIYLKAKRLKKK